MSLNSILAAGLVLSSLLAQSAFAQYSSRFVDNINLTIPDNTAAGVEIEFDFRGQEGNVGQVVLAFDGDGPCDGSIDDSLFLGLSHSFVSDLQATLISPTGQEVRLFSNIAGGFGGRNLCNVMFSDFADTSLNEANFQDAPFPGFWKPEQSLTTFNGLPASGVWRLRIADRVRGDVGQVQGVTLYITTQTIQRNTIPPQVNIDIPRPSTTFNGPLVTFQGNAFDLRNQLDRVEYVIRNSTNQSFDFQPATNLSDDWTEWTVQAELPIDEQSEFYVRAVNTNGDVGAVATRFGTTLFVPSNPPTLTVTRPASANSTFSVSIPELVFEGSATTTNPQGLGFVQSRIGTTASFTNRQNLGGAPSADWTFSLDPNFDLDDPTEVQIRVLDANGTASTVVSRVITLSETNTPPTVVVTEPASNENFTSLLSSRRFRGTASDVDGLVNRVEYRIPSNETTAEAKWFLATDSSAGEAWSSWEFTAEFENLQSFVDVFVRARDIDGDFSTQVTRRLVVTTTGSINPVVTITDPVANVSVNESQSSILVQGFVTPNNVGLSDFEFSLTNTLGTVVQDVALQSDNSFSVIVPVELGANNLQFRATNQLNFSSINGTANSRVITRVQSTLIPPTATIQLPAPLTITVPNTQTSIRVTGVSSSGTNPLASVLGSFGPNSVTQSAEAPVISTAGTFAEWEYEIPLQPFNNVVRITPVDSFGNRGTTVSRTIIRQFSPVSLNVTSPAVGVSLPPNTSNVGFTGTTADADGAVQLIQYRVTTPNEFFPQLNFLRTEGKQISSFFQNATDVSEENDWTNWEFTVPLGAGVNTVEVRALDSSFQTIATTQRTVTVELEDMYLIR
jgi:subtilisin-like proprotein convertase family protein